ncbi:MAG: GAF domain-containing protein [Proteobacteria bacterium]|nr:GAF domain-containing protein [Pseudomonadota bacterium]
MGDKSNTTETVINSRYRVIRTLGGGAQGKVYEVIDALAPGQKTALKILTSGAPGALLRFEFEQLSKLKHPHIAKVYDLGLVAEVARAEVARAEVARANGPEVGAAFFTQELVDGEPVHKWALKLPAEQRALAVAKVGVSVARALGLLHARGLLHRDIKPSNILVGGDGALVKLIDLGLSRLTEGLDGLTAGTIEYMAPEALRGFPDERSDLFSLGITMSELLIGRAPRLGKPLSSKAPPHVNTKLWKLLRRLVELRPDQRLQSARETVLAFGRAMGAGILGLGRETELLDASSQSETDRTRAAQVRSADLIGRSEELSQLGRWLGDILAEKGNTVGAGVMVGPPGVGKSRLFKTAVVEAQLCAAKARSAPPAMLKGSLRELMRAVVQDEEPGERPLLWRWLHGNPAEQAHGETNVGSSALLKDMAHALVGIGHPSAVLIEDGDTALTSGLLTWLAQAPTSSNGIPLAVVAEMRDDISSQSIKEQGNVLRIDVRPLDEDAETEMVAGVLGRRPDMSFMKRLHKLTGGVPLLTEAVLAALLQTRTDGRVERENLNTLDIRGDPGGLVLAGLLAGLEGPARALTESLAVINRPATIDEVMAVSEIDDPATALEVVHRLERLGWLTRDGKEQLSLPGFISQSLEKSLPSLRARALHKKVLSVLKKRPGIETGLLAKHAADAGIVDEAQILARQAAYSLKAAGDLTGAAEQLELLLKLGTAPDLDALEIELARICRQTGQYDRTISLAEAMEERTGKLPPGAALEKAAALRLSGNLDSALTLLTDLIAASDTDIALEARAIAARIELDRGNLKSAAERIGKVAAQPDPRLVRSGVLSTAGLIALHLGDHERAGDLFEAGLQAAQEMDDLRNSARFNGLVGMVSHGRGDWDSALKSYGAALELADTAGDRHGAATYAVNLAAAYTELDQVREALDWYRDGLERLRRIGRASELAQAGANYAQLLLRVGDVEGADAAASQALADAKPAATGRVIAFALCVKGDVLLSLGKGDKAYELLIEAEELAGKSGATAELVTCRQHLAASALSIGNKTDAQRWLAMAGEAGEEENISAVIEQKRLQLEIALAGEEDPGGELDSLVDMLETKGENRRLDQVNAFATAARAAKQIGRMEQALKAAETALGILSSLQLAIPSLHRQAEMPLAREMEEICEMVLGTNRNMPAEGQVSSENWEQLVRINKRLNSELRVGRLLELIMDTAIDITQAERGFLLIADPQGNLSIRCARNIDRESLDQGEQSYSRSVAHRSFEMGESVLTTDAQEDERFQNKLSVVNLNLRYIAAVPLQVKGKTTGAIYLDSRRGARFDESRIVLLGALADQAAIALTNARLTVEIKRRQQRIEHLNRQLAIKLESREGELERVKGELAKRTDELITRYKYEGIVARSQAMDNVFKLLDRVVDSDLPVVVMGESGTGKELVARALHFNGPRKRKSFVAENCAAIPETLLESAFFGHVRGAFTGAIQDSPGLFVEANGGTLFLDEVSQMPLAMQVKLLRVLQDGTVRPVGGSKTTKVDARIVVASNADLSAMVKDGTFREDLYYRLNVMSIKIPPLRKRTEDIHLLAEHFTAKHGGDNPPRISKQALEALIQYPWPGNVRQLENEMMRAIVLCDDIVEIDHLSEDIISGVSHISESLADLNMNRQVERLKQRLISIALKKTGGNQTNAAELLGLSRYGLQKMIARFESKPE